MVRHLLADGYSVVIWNRSREKCSSLVSEGAVLASSVVELVRNCDIVMLCVSNTQVVEEVVFGEGGVIESIRKDQMLVDFSSIDPQATRLFARRLATHCGAEWVDAPVSGGVAGAEDRSLAIMVGGEAEVIDRLRPVLSSFSQRITHMGPVGSGQTTKVCNQMLVSCNVLVMAEVLALAEKASVDSRKIPEALEGGFADSIPLQLTGSRMANREFAEVKWHVKTLLKDLNLARSLSMSKSAETPMTRLAAELMDSYVEMGYADKDPSTLIQPYITNDY